jgi:hypothetical protein
MWRALRGLHKHPKTKGPLGPFVASALRLRCHLVAQAALSARRPKSTNAAKVRSSRAR